MVNVKIKGNVGGDTNIASDNSTITKNEGKVPSNDGPILKITKLIFGFLNIK